jgi:ribonucleoside-diphosphate reductase alpha chain
LPNSNNEKQRAERRKPPCLNRESVSCAVWSFNGYRVGLKLATSEIRNPDGSIVFQLKDIEVPAAWSQVASDILAQKYFRKAGVPARLKKVEENSVPSWLWRSVEDTEALAELPEDERYSSEMSAQQVFNRLAGTWTYWGWKGGYFDAKKTRRPSMTSSLHAGHADRRAELAAVVQHRPALGLRHRRPRPGPSLRRFRNRQAGPVAVAYEHPQPHACFIQSSPTTWSTKAASWTCGCVKHGCSSTAPAPAPTSRAIRGENEPLSGGGKSSGLMSFLKIGDRAAGAIKSGGTTRRAAKMVVVDIDHPDIEAFIDWKVSKSRRSRHLSPARRRPRSTSTPS